MTRTPPIRPVVLCVLDGFGLAPAGPGNAVAAARTPVFDALWRGSPHATLAASGPSVGLPEGQMGNSEVGHLNLGAGRVVMQSLSFVQRTIDDGSFFENEVLTSVCDAVRQGDRTLHLVGLVSRGGVHADLPHLFALIDLARRRGVGRVHVHALTDGRDTPPDSARRYLGEVVEHIARSDAPARIASVIGRYWAMDRDARWERTERAFDAIVCGDAPHRAASADEAIAAAYARGETDEFIAPTLITAADGSAAGMVDGDGVIAFNFRADRARQLTHALLGDASWNAFDRCRTPRLHFASLMRYDRTLDAPFALEVPELHRPLGEVIAAAGLTQYRTAETEKYPHVTYFFNATVESPYPGEVRHMVPSPRVATYDLQPEMSADALTDATIARLERHEDAFVLINYANPDMVGHTGVFAAAVRACETVDTALGRLVEATRAKGGCLLVLADHGNAEMMLDGAGGPHTAHTTNPVPCVLVDEPTGVTLRTGGVLGDVAPTVLELLGLDVPDVMTGRSLLVG
ncbi:2,3-bisphosphoglycerate-independent phosphoglycerate mutase [soil metagenome]